MTEILEFKFHYPARGRKPLERIVQVFVSLSFKFHYPARGRKPRSEQYGRCTYSVQIPLPRKGTETLPLALFNLIAGHCSNSITPQGDGNVVSVGQLRKLKAGRSNSITPQGDGNVISRCGKCTDVPFKFHYPARGRKPTPLKVSVVPGSSSNSITPQGDGNLTPGKLQLKTAVGSNSITPQGDGNRP